MQPCSRGQAELNLKLRKNRESWAATFRKVCNFLGIPNDKFKMKK